MFAKHPVPPFDFTPQSWHCRLGSLLCGPSAAVSNREITKLLLGSLEIQQVDQQLGFLQHPGALINVKGPATDGLPQDTMDMLSISVNHFILAKRGSHKICH